MTRNGINGNGTNGTLASNRDAIDRFINRLRDRGNVRASCEAAGVSRTTVYRWRDKFVTFRDEWDEAIEDACDILEATAWTRAIEKDSDRLLMFLLKAHRRKVYGEHIAVDAEMRSVVRVIGGVDLGKMLPPMPETDDD